MTLKERKAAIAKSESLRALFAITFLSTGEFLRTFGVQIDEVERYRVSGEAPSPRTVALLANAKLCQGRKIK